MQATVADVTEIRINSRQLLITKIEVDLVEAENQKLYDARSAAAALFKAATSVASPSGSAASGGMACCNLTNLSNRMAHIPPSVRHYIPHHPVPPRTMHSHVPAQARACYTLSQLPPMGCKLTFEIR